MGILGCGGSIDPAEPAPAEPVMPASLVVAPVIKAGAQGDNVTLVQYRLKRAGFTTMVDTEPERGKFDAATEMAVRAFQGHYGIKVTGTVDPVTARLLNTPRCGVPDVGGLKLAKVVWNKKKLTYGVTDETKDLTPAESGKAFRDAFDAWEGACGLKFEKLDPDKKPDILILFAMDSHGDFKSFDGKGGELAHAYYPPPAGDPFAGDGHFDDAETWVVIPGQQGTDLVAVATHEFGHSIGLDHSKKKGDVMFAYYPIPRKLTAEDTKRAQALYGKP